MLGTISTNLSSPFLSGRHPGSLPKLCTSRRAPLPCVSIPSSSPNRELRSGRERLSSSSKGAYLGLPDTKSLILCFRAAMRSRNAPPDMATRGDAVRESFRFVPLRPKKKTKEGNGGSNEGSLVSRQASGSASGTGSASDHARAHVERIGWAEEGVASNPRPMRSKESSSRWNAYVQLHEITPERDGIETEVRPFDGQERLDLEGVSMEQVQEERHKVDYLSTCMLCLATFCLFADQNLMAPNLQAIADDFGLKGKQKDQFLGGIMSIAFFFVGAPSSLIVGSLADSPRTKRVFLFVVVLLIGEIPAAMTIFVGTGWAGYWQLFVLRSITGVAIGGALPVVISILADIYSSSQRNVASAVYSTAMGAGLVFGQTFSALTGYSNWRIPFFLVAVPSILVSLGCLVLIKEPRRGAAEEVLAKKFKDNPEYEYMEDVGWKTNFMRTFFIPSNLLTIIQGVPGSIPWGVLNVYLNDYLNVDAGLSLADSTSVVVTFAAGCGLIGNVVGGVLGQVLWNRSPKLLPLAMGITTIAATFPVEVLINLASSMSQILRLVLAFVAGSVACFTAANIRAVLMNVNTPNTRGTVFACFNLMNDIGAGLGPGLVSVFVTLFESRQTAFSVAITMWFLCGALQGGLYWTVPSDVICVQEKLWEQARMLNGGELGVLLPVSDTNEVGSHGDMPASGD